MQAGAASAFSASQAFPRLTRSTPRSVRPANEIGKAYSSMLLAISTEWPSHWARASSK